MIGRSEWWRGIPSNPVAYGDWVLRSTPEQIHAARLVCAGAATDAKDLRLLLNMLGIRATA